MKLFLFLFFPLVGSIAYGQTAKDSVSVHLLKSIVYTMADDSMKGRASGSYEEEKTLEYLSKTFTSLTGKDLKKQTFSFLKDSVKYTCTNAYYFKNNHAKNTIIVGAHYDHIGLGGPLSLSYKSIEIHNGADDNASGVALLLSLSPDLIRGKNRNVNYLIVFYSGHEVGLFGSSAFLKMVQERHKFNVIRTVINFDMVGRLDPSHKKVKCMRSPELDSLISVFPKEQFSIQLNIADEEKLKQLDTKCYLEAGIPCVNFTTGIHNDYHKTSDDASYINYSGLNELRKFLIYFLIEAPF